MLDAFILPSSSTLATLTNNYGDYFGEFRGGGLAALAVTAVHSFPVITRFIWNVI